MKRQEHWYQRGHGLIFTGLWCAGSAWWHLFSHEPEIYVSKDSLRIVYMGCDPVHGLAILTWLQGEGNV